MDGDDDPDVALAAALAVVGVGLDEYLVVGLVAFEVLVLPDGLPHGLVQLVEQTGCFLEKAMGRRFVNGEAVLREVVHDTLHGHRVQVAQLGDAGDERSVVTGVQQRGERGLGTYEGTVHFHCMDVEDFLLEPGRYHTVADNVTGTERIQPFHALGIDIPFHRLHLEVHVALCAVVAARLALSRLAFLLCFLLLFGFGHARLRLLLLGLVLNQLGKAPHLVLRLGQVAVAFYKEGFKLCNGLFHGLHRRRHLPDSGIGHLQLVLKHLDDHILAHIRKRVCFRMRI